MHHCNVLNPHHEIRRNPDENRFGGIDREKPVLAGYDVFRYATQRAHAGHWLPYAQGLVTACTQHPTGDVTVKAWGGHYYAVPCPRIRR